VEKSYRAGGTEFQLSVPHLDISGGAKLAFVGESGSGKSTLLELLAMILSPTRCDKFEFSSDPDAEAVDVAAAWQSADADRLSSLRSRHIGYVLQNGGLLPYLTVKDNIELSRRLLRHECADAAENWARKLNIAAQLKKFPAELSVGQRQRVAIARALAHDPTLLIADEPTASVDPVNARRIMELMVSLADEMGVTLIVASHAHELVQQLGLKLITHRIDTARDTAMHVTVANAGC